MTAGSWNQQPDGIVTIDRVLANHGAPFIADALGVTPRAVYRWRKYGRTFTIDQAIMMADLLGIPVGELWPELESRFVKLEPRPVGWRERANCIGISTDLFFPRREDDAAASYNLLRPICWACPVRIECLEEALYYEQNGGDPMGFSGGATPRERAFLREVRREYKARKTA